MNNWWLWLLTFSVLLATSAALVAMDARSRRKKRAGEAVARLDDGCHGVCCVCSLVFKHRDEVIAFCGNALVWTGALSLKRAIDTTVRPNTTKLRAACSCCAALRKLSSFQRCTAAPLHIDGVLCAFRFL